jgi:hypothetical protein
MHSQKARINMRMKIAVKVDCCEASVQMIMLSVEIQRIAAKNVENSHCCVHHGSLRARVFTVGTVTCSAHEMSLCKYAPNICARDDCDHGQRAAKLEQRQQQELARREREEKVTTLN